MWLACVKPVISRTHTCTIGQNVVALTISIVCSWKRSSWSRFRSASFKSWVIDAVIRLSSNSMWVRWASTSAGLSDSCLLSRSREGFSSEVSTRNPIKIGNRWDAFFDWTQTLAIPFISKVCKIYPSFASNMCAVGFKCSRTGAWWRSVSKMRFSGLTFTVKKTSA